MAAGPDLGSAVVAACLLSWSRLLGGRLAGRTVGVSLWGCPNRMVLPRRVGGPVRR